MNELEKYPQKKNGTPSGEDLRDCIRDLKREIYSEWKRYKLYHRNMHGTEIEDNEMEMILLFMIKTGFLKK